MVKDKILVVGSINMDLAVRCPVLPGPGETVMGDGFQTSPGGKGANQAVAIARLRGHCVMIGKVGKDAFGGELLAGLQVEGVDCAGVSETADAPTGTAMIIVDSNGENSIVVAGGANSRVTPDDDIYPHEDLFRQAAIVLMQLELPLPTVRAAVDLARRHGCRVILDPSPAPCVVPDDLFQLDILTPNTHEAEMITGKHVRNASEDKMAASDLIARGAKNIVLKLGPRGALVVTADQHFYTVPPYKVNVIDTTAAGDAFTGALALAIVRGQRIREAAKFASAVGALACTKLGAQTAMPTAEEVAILMEDQPR